MLLLLLPLLLLPRTEGRKRTAQRSWPRVAPCGCGREARPKEPRGPSEVRFALLVVVVMGCMGVNVGAQVLRLFFGSSFYQL